jgi:CheY-like chemotaxis protein
MKFLVVDDEPRNLYAITAVLQQAGVGVTLVETGTEAVDMLAKVPGIDVVLMDIHMPEMDGYDAIRAIRDTGLYPHLRVVAVTGKVTAGERKRCLDAGADGYVPKPVDTAELFGVLRPWLPLAGSQAANSFSSLSAVATEPSPIRVPVNIEGRLKGRTVLVVDDDFRNIFAMTALLERAHATVTSAESGAEALAALQRNPDVDIVLMDIMMPVMDGYETMRAIRKLSGFDGLPIVAVTGKAAAGERQRCLDAGADDYIPKPVNTGELLSALKPWLPLPEVLVTP